MFFTFPEDARWNAERQGWSSGSRRRVPRGGPGSTAPVFPLSERPTCELNVEGYYQELHGHKLRWTAFYSQPLRFSLMSVTRRILMRMFGEPRGLLGRLGGIIMAHTNDDCAAWVI